MFKILLEIPEGWGGRGGLIMSRKNGNSGEVGGSHEILSVVGV